MLYLQYYIHSCYTCTKLCIYIMGTLIHIHIIFMYVHDMYTYRRYMYVHFIHVQHVCHVYYVGTFECTFYK